MAYYRLEDVFKNADPHHLQMLAWQERERERERKNQRQKAIAERLSELAAEDYGEDALDAMIDTEVGSRLDPYSQSF